MTRNWNRWTAGMVSGFALVVLLAGCEAKKNESSQTPADPSQSMATGQQPEGRDAPLSPAPDAAQRPGVAGQDKSGNQR